MVINTLTGQVFEVADSVTLPDYFIEVDTKKSATKKSKKKELVDGNDRRN